MAATHNDSPNRYLKVSEEELNRYRSQKVSSGKNTVLPMLGKVGFYLLLVVMILYSLFPFYWAIVSSLKGYQELVRSDVTYWPENPTLDNYRTIFNRPEFMYALRNSLIVSVAVTLLALLMGTVASYAIARLQFRGRKAALYLILSMTMFPGVAIIGSLFRILQRTGSYNTLYALVVIYLTFALPFTIWTLSNFFRAMPPDLEQAAMVDGATPMVALRQVLMPLAVPGMVTTGMLAFIEAWSEFLYANTFTTPGDRRTNTVQVVINNFTGNTQYEDPYALKMAAAVVVTVPLLVGVLVFQKKIVAGLTAGAVKG